MRVRESERCMARPVKNEIERIDKLLQYSVVFAIINV